MGGFMLAIAIEKWNLHRAHRPKYNKYNGNRHKKNRVRIYDRYGLYVNVDFKYSYLCNDVTHWDRISQTIKRESIIDST